jgi:hypothetical protein
MDGWINGWMDGWMDGLGVFFHGRMERNEITFCWSKSNMVTYHVSPTFIPL